MTKDEIKEMYSMRDIVSRYGIQINRSGFCSCPFHTGDRTPSLKIYAKDYHCHACGAHGDIFTWVMQMDGLSFKDAFASLGGTKELSFSAKIKIEQELAKRKHQEYLQSIAQEKHRTDLMYVTAYSNLLHDYEPLSEEWCYIYNKLQYKLYLLEQWGEEQLKR